MEDLPPFLYAEQPLPLPEGKLDVSTLFSDLSLPQTSLEVLWALVDEDCVGEGGEGRGGEGREGKGSWP